MKIIFEYRLKSCCQKHDSKCPKYLLIEFFSSFFSLRNKKSLREQDWGSQENDSNQYNVNSKIAVHVSNQYRMTRFKPISKDENTIDPKITFHTVFANCTNVIKSVLFLGDSEGQ